MTQQLKHNLIVLLGATASGKTHLGVLLAQLLNGEIISADSRQVYRGMDIGSGKDLEEYGDVPYHLIDIADPEDEYNVYEFQKDFLNAYTCIQERGRMPLLVGGTGLYLDSVLKAYNFLEVPRNTSLRERLQPYSDNELAQYLSQLNQTLHNTTDLLDRDRTLRAIEIAYAKTKMEEMDCDKRLQTISPIVLGLRWPRPKLQQRIALRLRQRIDGGLIEEVDNLYKQGVSWQKLHFFGLEYRYVARYLQGELNKNDMYQKLNSSICQFAKQQEKWFRRMERNGITIHWLDGSGPVLKQAIQILEGHTR
ncbi:tRNA (adenosine(37)-N6)-dimethylallyltransferase MiaA [Teredinibacter sp. KSP-S5-2]|uniref:tRNA (adenosine(37)-N6)-dimethylallyltransferase MiaA n=1 Tax=Teredinibacter sp. KSP-S5-2 TaxID=3034506 RepID=UPI0029341C2F|nr:tRNA (adenosine(37)-N6)-dimethylallyltransferase MiaA [Teredinibacter sp. KSP-S5-2]WNO11006.1 tRNA (adenosine(37)-N6)-dimethylallyltransferase MiaA [Teredinibacter sp. KSP-S5-2]